jgi:hypothetical protein
MEAADLNPPLIEITTSDSEVQSSFQLWYEKLSSFWEKKLIPEWSDDDDQNPFNWHFY